MVGVDEHTSGPRNEANQRGRDHNPSRDFATMGPGGLKVNIRPCAELPIRARFSVLGKLTSTLEPARLRKLSVGQVDDSSLIV